MNKNKVSADRLFHVDAHGPKKFGTLNQPDEKTTFKILKRLFWTQFVTIFFMIFTYFVDNAKEFKSY